MTLRIEGGCLCGAVRYAAHGAPRFSLLCHCTTCRRASGATPVGWITVARAGFALTRGAPVTIASTPPVRRTLCGACGTALTYTHDDAPDTIDVTTCSLDDPDAFPPTYHAWLDDAPRWPRLADDGLIRYPRSRPEGAA